jgi:outer membrane beta-barrel protein
MNKMSQKIRILFVILAIGVTSERALAQAQPANSQEIEVDPMSSGPKKNNLDRSLQPGTNDEISSLFENVVAVQRKAKVKAGKYILNPYFSYDFSDAPFTMYGFNLNVGYAISEFWEVYFNYVPSYMTNERSIAKKVDDLGLLANGQKAEVSMEKAKSSFGVEVNWIPIYGKDSWGPYGIIRSDTFLNFQAGQVTYTEGSGMKYKLALGKTFFLSEYLNLRFMAGAAYVQMRALGKTEGVTIGLLESGLVFYF